MSSATFRAQIDGIEIIAVEDEVWFVQNERVCWIKRTEAWSSLARLTMALRARGFRFDEHRFPRRLRQLIINPSMAVEAVLID